MRTFVWSWVLFFSLTVMASLQYRLEFSGEGEEAKLLIEGHSPVRSSKSRAIAVLRDIPGFKDLSHYLVKAEWDEEQSVASFKLCYLLFCSEPQVRMLWQDARMDWEYLTGQFAGSHGSVEIVNELDQNLKMQFTSHYLLSKSRIPDWILRKVVRAITERSLTKLIQKMEKPALEQAKSRENRRFL